MLRVMRFKFARQRDAIPHTKNEQSQLCGLALSDSCVVVANFWIIDGESVQNIARLRGGVGLNRISLVTLEET
jgi:hypothetical protein